MNFLSDRAAKSIADLVRRDKRTPFPSAAERQTYAGAQAPRVAAVRIVASRNADNGWFPGRFVYRTDNESTTTTSTTSTSTTSSTTEDPAETTTTLCPEYTPWNAEVENDQDCWVVFRDVDADTVEVGDVFSVLVIAEGDPTTDDLPLCLFSDNCPSDYDDVRTTTTSIDPDCTGVCTWTQNETTGLWELTTDSCSDTCYCAAPTFCPPTYAGLACATTQTDCVYIGSHATPPVCSLTTTTTTTLSPEEAATSTTTTTTISPECTTTLDPTRCEYCEWYHDPRRGIILTVARCGPATICQCPPPPSVSELAQCNTDRRVCVPPPPPPPPPCECCGYCEWSWSYHVPTATFRWQRVYGTCSYRGAQAMTAAQCRCDKPNYDGTDCHSWAITGCYVPTPPTTTTTVDPCSVYYVPTTTSTTPDPIGECTGGPCYWQGDGADGWTLIGADPCSGGCECIEPAYSSADECSIAFTVCGPTPSTTSTTSSTTSTTSTTSSTTSTTTTTTANPACAEYYCIELVQILLPGVSLDYEAGDHVCVPCSEVSFGEDDCACQTGDIGTPAFSDPSFPASGYLWRGDGDNVWQVHMVNGPHVSIGCGGDCPPTTTTSSTTSTSTTTTTTSTTTTTTTTTTAPPACDTHTVSISDSFTGAPAAALAGRTPDTTNTPGDTWAYAGGGIVLLTGSGAAEWVKSGFDLYTEYNIDAGSAANYVRANIAIDDGAGNAFWLYTRSNTGYTSAVSARIDYAGGSWTLYLNDGSSDVASAAVAGGTGLLEIYACESQLYARYTATGQPVVELSGTQIIPTSYVTTGFAVELATDGHNAVITDYTVTELT